MATNEPVTRAEHLKPIYSLVSRRSNDFLLTISEDMFSVAF